MRSYFIFGIRDCCAVGALLELLFESDCESLTLRSFLAKWSNTQKKLINNCSLSFINYLCTTFGLTSGENREC